jgi:hypothetical protein
VQSSLALAKRRTQVSAGVSGSQSGRGPWGAGARAKQLPGMPVRGERVHPLDSTADVLSVENPSGLASPLQEPSHGEMAGVGALEGGERSPDSVEAEEAKGSGGESQVHDVEFMSAKMFGDKAELMTDRQKNILKMVRVASSPSLLPDLLSASAPRKLPVCSWEPANLITVSFSCSK